MKKDTIRLFEQICIHALARREYSRRELAGKAPDNLSIQEINNILDGLAEKGWQSDQRFCEIFVRSKVQKGDGSLKIRHALKQRGIVEDIIRNTLETVDWFSAAKSVYQKKYRDTPIKNHAERAKRQRFMAQRGFSFEEISAILN